MLSQRTLETEKKILERWKESPTLRHSSFSSKKLWSKQEEILWSVRRNKRTCVKSGNTVGKSWIAADVVMDFLTVNYPAEVITTAPCYDDKTEILTNSGWKFFENLNNNDLIFQIDDDSKGSFVKIEGFVKYRFDGELIGYKSQLCDFLVTPEHRCVVRTKNGSLKARQANEIYGSWYVSFPRLCQIPTIENGLSLDFCEFLGFWFAEGCSQYVPADRRYRVIVTQKSKIKYTENLLTRNDFKFHKYSKGNGCFNYEIYNKKLSEYFEQFKKGARNKCLPDFIKFFDKNRAEKFLHGFLQGDGGIDKNGSVRLYTSSKSLADDLQLLCMKVGWIANISKNGFCKGRFSKNEFYVLRIWLKRGKNIQAKKVHWYKHKYNGFVYCVKVPSGMVMVRRNGKTIISGNTWSQVEDILWKEIHRYYNNSLIPLGGELLKTSFKLTKESIAYGISTNEAVRFQGRHSENLFVVIDEASGVTSDIWMAVEALHPSRVLAIGNPMENSGNFYDAFNSPLWNQITISCLDCVAWQDINFKVPGLVTQEWIDERKQEWGEKSPLYAIHVLGEFPEEGIDNLISRAWVENCRKNKLDEQEEDETRINSCDVATKHGENETVIGYRYGHTFKEIRGYHHMSVDKTADRLGWEFSEKKSSGVVVDADGVGEGLVDILISRHFPTIGFHSGYGQKAIDATKFRNLRSQFYWIIARKFEKGQYDLTQLSEKEYQILKNQLCSIKVRLPDAQGRVTIETKDDMMTRGIKSPDFADCFMFSEYGWYMCKYILTIKPQRYI